MRVWRELCLHRTLTWAWLPLRTSGRGGHAAGDHPARPRRFCPAFLLYLRPPIYCRCSRSFIPRQVGNKVHRANTMSRNTVKYCNRRLKYPFPKLSPNETSLQAAPNRESTPWWAVHARKRRRCSIMHSEVPFFDLGMRHADRGSLRFSGSLIGSVRRPIPRKGYI